MAKGQAGFGMERVSGAKSTVGPHSAGSFPLVSALAPIAGIKIAITHNLDLTL